MKLRASTRVLCEPLDRGGFSLVQILVALGVLALMLGLGMPALQGFIQRTRMEGFGRSLTSVFVLARNRSAVEAVQVVVQVEEDEGRVLVFRDRDGAAAGTAPDGLFNPVEGAPAGTTDDEISFHQLPPGVQLSAPGSEDVVEGFTEVAGDRVAIFCPNGSVRDEGAVRYADQWGNFLEVRVYLTAAPRVQLRKYRKEGDVEGWFTRETNGGPWEWSWGRGRSAA